MSLPKENDYEINYIPRGSKIRVSMTHKAQSKDLEEGLHCVYQCETSIHGVYDLVVLSEWVSVLVVI